MRYQEYVNYDAQLPTPLVRAERAVQKPPAVNFVMTQDIGIVSRSFSYPMPTLGVPQEVHIDSAAQAFLYTSKYHIEGLGDYGGFRQVEPGNKSTAVYFLHREQGTDSSDTDATSDRVILKEFLSTEALTGTPAMASSMIFKWAEQLVQAGSSSASELFNKVVQTLERSAIASTLLQVFIHDFQTVIADSMNEEAHNLHVSFQDGWKLTGQVDISLLSEILQDTIDIFHAETITDHPITKQQFQEPIFLLDVERELIQSGKDQMVAEFNFTRELYEKDSQLVKAGEKEYIGYARPHGLAFDSTGAVYAVYQDVSPLPEVVPTLQSPNLLRKGTIREVMENNPHITVGQLRSLWEDIVSTMQSPTHMHLPYRDAKPDNFVIGDDGRVRQIDLAAYFQTGRTDDYAAPEQNPYLPGKVDLTTDVFSFAIMLYEMVTGHVPTRAGIVRAIEPLDIRFINIFPDLATVLVKAMDFRQNHRYEDVLKLADAVRKTELYTDLNIQNLPLFQVFPPRNETLISKRQTMPPFPQGRR